MIKRCFSWVIVCAATLTALSAYGQSVGMPLDHAAADHDEGYYQIGPRQAIHFWREGDHFYFGAVGTPQHAQAVPEASHRFSYANGAVTFTFNVGVDGKVSGMTLNQAGRVISAPRIDEAVAKGMPAPGAVDPATAAGPRTWIVMTGAAPKEITARTVGT